MRPRPVIATGVPPATTTWVSGPLRMQSTVFAAAAWVMSVVVERVDPQPLISSASNPTAPHQRIRQGRLNEAPRRRPIEAHFIQGRTSRRALVIAGVHGSERQGIDVARMLLSDLSKTQPLYTVILVPSISEAHALGVGAP